MAFPERFYTLLEKLEKLEQKDPAQRGVIKKYMLDFKQRVIYRLKDFHDRSTDTLQQQLSMSAMEFLAAGDLRHFRLAFDPLVESHPNFMGKDGGMTFKELQDILIFDSKINSYLLEPAASPKDKIQTLNQALLKFYPAKKHTEAEQSAKHGVSQPFSSPANNMRTESSYRPMLKALASSSRPGEKAAASGTEHDPLLMRREVRTDSGLRRVRASSNLSESTAALLAKMNTDIDDEDDCCCRLLPGKSRSPSQGYR